MVGVIKVVGATKDGATKATKVDGADRFVAVNFLHPSPVGELTRESWLSSFAGLKTKTKKKPDKSSADLMHIWTLQWQGYGQGQQNSGYNYNYNQNYNWNQNPWSGYSQNSGYQQGYYGNSSGSGSSSYNK